MNYQKWEVWLQRVSLFENDGAGSARFAERLVESGACVCAYDSAGRVLIRSESGSRWEPMPLQLRPHDVIANFTVPASANAYQKLCLIVAAEASFAERRVFHHDALKETHHVRCFFDPILVGRSNDCFGLYPSVKLYDDGVAIASLRMFSPSEPWSIQRIVRDSTTIGMRHFDRLLLSRPLLQATPVRDYLSSLICLNRTEFKKVQADELSRILLGTEREHEHDGVSEEYIDISLSGLDGLIMMNVVWDCLDSCLDDKAFRPAELRPSSAARRLTYDRAWWHRTTLYLQCWNRQPARLSRANTLLNDVAKVLATSVNKSLRADFAQQDEICRPFDDMKIFANEAVSVYVFAKALTDHKFTNRPVAEQVVEEFALWLTTQYSRLERTLVQPRRATRASALRRQYLELRRLHGRSMAYGEIRDRVNRIAGLVGLPSTSKNVKDLLSVVDSAQSARASLLLTRMGVIVSVLFGIASAGQVAQYVVVPLRRSGVIYGHSQLPQTTADFAAAGVVMLLVLLLSLLGTLALSYLSERKQ